MKQSRQQNKLLQQLFAAIAVFISRLGVLPANISPLGSFGFFGNPLFYGISIIAFDLLVKGIYPGFWLTYIGFACYPILGYLSANVLKKQLFYLPFASLLFFLISNLGVWWYWYDHTFAKLLVCYILAVPFYGRTLISDIIFGYGYLLIVHFQKIKNVSLSSKKLFIEGVSIK
jgi:hypothetical protein